MLYGLMTEEIKHSYEERLYAELIRNRIFKDNAKKLEGWRLVNGDTVRPDLCLHESGRYGNSFNTVM